MSRGRALEPVGLPPKCLRSPDGHHNIIKGTVSDYCGSCWVVVRYTTDDHRDDVRVNGKPLRPTVQAGGRKIRVYGPPKGTTKRNHTLELIDRDGAECFYCEHALLDPRVVGERPNAQWWPTLDHLLPRTLGGRNELNNLVLACRECNGRKGEHVLLLAEVIRRLRRKLRTIEERRAGDRGYIERLQWELFDAGLGEIPGHIDIAKGTSQPYAGGARRTASHGRPKCWYDDALFIEMGDRVCANLRAENKSTPHGRTAAIVKRGRILVRREKVMAE